MNISSISSRSETENRLSEIDRITEQISETFFEKECADIMEVTYAYLQTPHGTFINKTLYGTFLQGKTPPDNDEYWEQIMNNLARYTEDIEGKLIRKKEEIRRFRNVLQSYGMDILQATLLLRTLNSIENIFEVTRLGLPFEAEKAGIPLQISEEETEGRVQKMEALEGRLFGGNIRENGQEITEIYYILSEKYQNGKHFLQAEEQEQFEAYLNTISSLENFQNKTDIHTEEALPNHLDILDEDTKNMKISREKYVKIFQLSFEIYHIDKPIIIDERSSIYDAPDALYIPDDDLHATLPLSKVFALIAHEIETHYVIEKNNTAVFGKFRGGGNLEREEGLAVFAEGILSGKRLDDFKINQSFSIILMGELSIGNFNENFGKYSMRIIAYFYILFIIKNI